MVNLEIVALKVKCERQYQTIIELQNEKIDLFKENQQLRKVIEKVKKYIDTSLDGMYSLVPDYVPDFSVVNMLEEMEEVLKAGDIDEKKN